MTGSWFAGTNGSVVPIPQREETSGVVIGPWPIEITELLDPNNSSPIAGE